MGEFDLDRAINEQLDTIILQAQALRDDRVTNRAAAVGLLSQNVDMLRKWELRRQAIGR